MILCARGGMMLRTCAEEQAQNKHRTSTAQNRTTGGDVHVGSSAQHDPRVINSATLALLGYAFCTRELLQSENLFTEKEDDMFTSLTPSAHKVPNLSNTGFLSSDGRVFSSFFCSAVFHRLLRRALCSRRGMGIRYL